MVAQAKKNCEQLILAGSNVARFNFSHGSHEEQLIRYEFLKEASEKLNIPYSFLLDTKGPEIRVYGFPEEGITYQKDAVINIYTLKKDPATSEGFCVYDASGKYNMAKDCKVDNKVLVEDGKMICTIQKVDVENGIVQVVVESTHLVKTNKRINLPGASYSIPFISEKDENDIKLACKYNFDYIAPSFVNNENNVKDIRKILNENGGKNIKIISKIESTDGIKNLKKILAVSDGIMVARGDLGVEIPFQEVPFYEEMMIKMCNEANKPIIVATQMLDSMEKNLLATRAEVMDVYVAGKLGTDATMTSGETAQGLFPFNVVKTMQTINQQSEFNFNYEKSIKRFKLSNQKRTYAVKKALEIAKISSPKNQRTLKVSFPYEFIVIFENDFEVIEKISNIRPAAAIIVVTDSKTLYTKFGLYYGIFTYLVPNLKIAKKDNKKVAEKAVKFYSVGSGKYKIYLNLK
jgi:pyruvate kinase